MVCIVAAVALCWGWWRFWFLCDDAYIAFRYVSNSIAGEGYVWNPAPFRPVEGYTSLAQVVLLDLTWRLTGVEPPDAANGWSLLWSLGSLGVIAVMVERLELSRRLAGWRTGWLVLVLAATLTNRTWLAWTSSGLETALWTLVLLGWVALGMDVDDRRRLGGWIAVAAVMPLVRPDGLLFLGATVVTAPVVALRSGRGRQDLVLGLPLVVPVAHLLWRMGTYGAWLPNTFAAKVSEPWPEMGARYLTSFVVEYGLWLWMPLAAVGLVVSIGRWRLGAVVTWSALVAHCAYYLVAVGGDHFECRLMVHWVPLVWLSIPWLLDQLRLPAALACGVAVVVLLVGLPIPWVHWWHSVDLTNRKEGARQHLPVAQHLPEWRRGRVAHFDAMQKEMIKAYVGLRWHSHRNYLSEQRHKFGEREQGAKISGEGLPVYVRNGIGYPSWVLPHVAIIDRHGLNDWVIARTPPDLENRKVRRMAHERRPPDGYVACFAPNVSVRTGGLVRVRSRAEPLEPEDVVACETHFAEVVKAARPPSP